MSKLVLTLTLIMSIGIFMHSYAQPTFNWGQQIGTEKAENGTNVKTDLQGNPIFVGSTGGSLYENNFGGVDGFIVKYDHNGNTLWENQFGTDKDDRIKCMDIANNGKIILVGNTRGLIENKSFGDLDILICQFDSEGKRIKNQILGTDSMDYARRIKIDYSNNIIISGDTKGKLGKNNYGKTDCFILKLDSLGNELFSIQFGTEAIDVCFGLAIDTNSNIYLSGYTKGGLSEELQGDWDGFIAKYSSQGKRIWIKQYGTSRGGIQIRQLYVDSEGFIYATGMCSGNYAGIDKGKTDVFVMKINNTGDVLWKDQFGSDSYDFSHDIIYVDGKGVIIGGSLKGKSFSRMSNFQGDLLWNYTFGENGSSCNYGMGIYQNRYLYITGYSNANLFKQNPYKKNEDIYIIKMELTE